MFNEPKDAIYRFRYQGVTHYVIEDDPNSESLRVRNAHGEKDFPKDELQRSIENGEAEISCQ